MAYYNSVVLYFDSYYFEVLVWYEVGSINGPFAPPPPHEECIEVAIPEIQRIQKYWTGHSNTATKPPTNYTELNRNKFILIHKFITTITT